MADDLEQALCKAAHNAPREGAENGRSVSRTYARAADQLLEARRDSLRIGAITRPWLDQSGFTLWRDCDDETCSLVKWLYGDELGIRLDEEPTGHWFASLITDRSRERSTVQLYPVTSTSEVMRLAEALTNESWPCETKGENL